MKKLVDQIRELFSKLARRCIGEHKKHYESDEDFISDSRAALLENKTPYANVILYVVVILIVTAVIWAKFAVMEEVTVGMGKVIPVSQVKKIQNLEGGILKKLLVHEGQMVSKGQVLVKLDETQFTADYREQQALYAGLRATMIRLTAEASGQKKLIFPKALLSQRPDLVQSEQALFSRQQKKLANKLRSMRRSIVLVEKELHITQPLVKKGVMSQLELLQLQRRLNDLRGTFDEEVLKFRQQAQAELSNKQAQAISLKEKIRSLHDRMLRTTVRSPVRGIVKQIHINTIGGVIKSGMDIMEIVPVGDSLLVEASVTPKDIAFIHPQQSATVKITAYDYSIYGGLMGVVTHISADSTKDEQGNSYYEVWVRTKRNYLGTKQRPLPIIPGMTASVHILTGHKSVLDYILKPILKAKHNALRER